MVEHELNTPNEQGGFGDVASSVKNETGGVPDWAHNMQIDGKKYPSVADSTWRVFSQYEKPRDYGNYVRVVRGREPSPRRAAEMMKAAKTNFRDRFEKSKAYLDEYRTELAKTGAAKMSRRYLAKIISSAQLLLILIISFECYGDVLRLNKLAYTQLEYAGTTNCSFIIDGYQYASGRCGLSVGIGGERLEFDYGSASHPPEGQGVVETHQGRTSGRWSGPFGGSSDDFSLGELVRSGDCWINKRAKICLYGRVHQTIGTCIIQIDKKQYLNGNCPIETYKPFGSFYLNDVCGDSDVRYSAHVVIEGKDVARGSWNDASSTPGFPKDLGQLSREGACWKNDNAKICAFDGRREASIICKLAKQIPEGGPSWKHQTSTSEPDGRCTFIVNNRTLIYRNCKVDIDANNIAIFGTEESSGTNILLTQNRDTMTGLWNGAHGRKDYSYSLGRLFRQKDCWTNANRIKVCVAYPKVDFECREHENDCRWKFTDQIK